MPGSICSANACQTSCLLGHRPTSMLGAGAASSLRSCCLTDVLTSMFCQPCHHGEVLGAAGICSAASLRRRPTSCKGYALQALSLVRGARGSWHLLGHLLPDVAAALVEGHLHAGKLVQHHPKVLRPVLLPPLHLLRITAAMSELRCMRTHLPPQHRTAELRDRSKIASGIADSA